MPSTLWTAYCPTCSESVSGLSPIQGSADRDAVRHADELQHVVQVVDADTWSAAHTVTPSCQLDLRIRGE